MPLFRLFEFAARKAAMASLLRNNRWYEDAENDGRCKVPVPQENPTPQHPSYFFFYYFLFFPCNGPPPYFVVLLCINIISTLIVFIRTTNKVIFCSPSVVLY